MSSTDVSSASAPAKRAAHGDAVPVPVPAAPSSSSSDSVVSHTPPPPPPAKNPPSTIVVVRGFKRPFTLPAAQRLLQTVAAYTRFWMDDIKSHCYCEFENIDTAVATRNALHGMEWPKGNNSVLSADFALHWVGTEPVATSNPLPSNGKPDIVPITTKAVRTLDELFLKTRTTPSLYWLPKTDAEAQTRLSSLKRPASSSSDVAQPPPPLPSQR